ncbi:AAA-domain-containing protein [Pseudovirgaria hyperparasitica]|uniref:AAA-domain-containing protein n=1 Tax=Pseudovirgaria hyperparasitica TaxID=470096 RepID=A0A6A6WCX4_9PEZI|nr:AAA-domain-containing protein [Pseudovirgaria hyperparasitica]KAF2760682.1 AAA-domain-containing protein [Pseudovirgaria hyperparasitica]
MIRNKSSSAMQKTYDDCYLICSTAVYFESQNNEAEALRSWRSALDQIYYHNAYKIPSNYQPRSETEKALRDSLHQLELQCKERVDLLEALKQSREDKGGGTESQNTVGCFPAPALPDSSRRSDHSDQVQRGWLGGGTVPPMTYPDLSRPPLPKRPSVAPRQVSGASLNGGAGPFSNSHAANAPPLLTATTSKSGTDQRPSRTPSPEKRGKMLRTLRPSKDGSRPPPTLVSTLRSKPPAASSKAATQAWGPTQPPPPLLSRASESANSSTARLGPTRSSLSDVERSRANGNMPSQGSRQSSGYSLRPSMGLKLPEIPPTRDRSTDTHDRRDRTLQASLPPAIVSHPRGVLGLQRSSNPGLSKPVRKEVQPLSYRKEYPKPVLRPDVEHATKSTMDTSQPSEPNVSSPIGKGRRKAVPPLGSYPRRGPRNPSEDSVSSLDMSGKLETIAIGNHSQSRCSVSSSDDRDMSTEETAAESAKWQAETERILKTLPRGIDEAAAKQILNEIVIQGDEVHWDDVAGLDIAKAALKETVVYPFLRPDLFMGLREPARGMLLFGPPGTGKTMLARAVATESRSTFFAISASSLTSKFLGESEKLVRALFALAKAIAPSIIFVDEIDSLLSSRSGSSEHEATRRIKTEFLIAWSDLAKAAAGREQTEKEKERGDASRVLVLAATNLPWDIDEAARRRFVRRQYIPLPEGHVRRTQLETLLSHQKHGLSPDDLDELIDLTEGFSGSDITALAKDAAMGPLRSLGEKLLHMTMDEIRPIQIQDFKASLVTIRPSVSKQGLKEFEDWAKEFGERGG